MHFNTSSTFHIEAVYTFIFFGIAWR